MTFTTFNVGLGFIGFGIMLLAFDASLILQASKRFKTTGTIVGYKQFPHGKLIASNTIYRGINFSWLRVVEFTDPRTGKKVQLYSNPGVRNPEPIGTTLPIAVDPDNTDPEKDYAIVQGRTSAYSLGKISLITGLIVYSVLLFMPKTSPLHFVGIVAGFGVIFLAGLKKVWHSPNQRS